MIDLKNVSRIYQVGSEKVYALDKATLHVDEGEFVSITGPSRERKIHADEYHRVSGYRGFGTYLLATSRLKIIRRRNSQKYATKKSGLFFKISI